MTAVLWTAIFAGIVIGIIGMLWVIDSAMRSALRGVGI